MTESMTPQTARPAVTPPLWPAQAANAKMHSLPYSEDMSQSVSPAPYALHTCPHPSAHEDIDPSVNAGEGMPNSRECSDGRRDSWQEVCMHAGMGVGQWLLGSPKRQGR